MPQGCDVGIKSELFHQELKLYTVNIPGRKSLFRPSQWTSVPDHGPRVTQGPASDLLASSWLLSKGPTHTHTHSDVSSFPRKFQNYGFGLSIPPDSSVCSSVLSGQNQIIEALPKPSLIPEVGMLASGARCCLFS